MNPTGATGPAAAAVAEVTSQTDLEIRESQRQAGRLNARLYGSFRKPSGPAAVIVSPSQTVDSGITAAVTPDQPQAEGIEHEKSSDEYSPTPKLVEGDVKAGRVIDLAKREAEFLSRVLPWPKDGEPGFINLNWLIPAPSDPNKLIWIGKPTRTIEEFLSLLEWVLSRPTTNDVYFCLSRQARAKKNSRGNLTAMRRQKDAVALKAIWLDIDVKPPPKGYATLEEAQDALTAFVKAAGLPPPTAVVCSGGGLHVYWISDKPLTPDEWRPYAEGLKAAAINFGLRCDTQCTVNAAQVLRVPGTFNHKTVRSRAVKLLSLG